MKKNTLFFNEILLRRRNLLNLNATFLDETSSNEAYVMCIMKNIQELGYTFSTDLIKALIGYPKHALELIYKELVSCLKEYVGANRTFNFMYPNFPTCIIDGSVSDLELLVNAFVMYLTNCRYLPEYEKDERLPLFESPELKVISLGSDKDVEEVFHNLVSTKTSLSEQDKTDLICLLNSKGITEMPEITYKENLPIISKVIMDNTDQTRWFNLLKNSFKTATDVLRLYVGLSDGDVSLAQPTKFKSMPRKTRKLIAKLLENCGNIEEDMKRYTMAWIKAGEKLHFGSDEYKMYSKTQTAFNKLRNDIKAIETFRGKVDAAMLNKDYCMAARLLKSRPGELARSLDDLIRNVSAESDRMIIVNHFIDIAEKVSVPVLLQVKEHFLHRNEKNKCRVFFPKGNTQKAYAIDNELEPISDEICKNVVDICDEAIMNQFKNKDLLGNVYISDSIKGFCIPQSQRSASSTMKNITRGSRFSLKPNTKFIRAGIAWLNELVDGQERRTDIDLSCSFLNEDFENIDYISYTHLRNKYSCHSGDIVDSPRGRVDSDGNPIFSAESLDIYLDKLPSNVRYAVFQVYGYTQTKFCDLEDMLFNWQEGESDDGSDGKIFEPSRVQNSFNLAGNTMCEIPIIIDLKEREIVWCDVSLSTRVGYPRNVESNNNSLINMTRGMISKSCPQMYDLALLNGLSRGMIVTHREDADVIFDINTTKPTITIEKEVHVVNEKGEILEVKTVTETKEKDCRIITPFDTDIWMGDLL